MIGLCIYGAPRTKKNSGRIVKPRGLSHAIVLPSAAYTKWRARVLPQLRIIAGKLRDRGHVLPLEHAVNCAAIFYREARIGDAVGYYQALADLLEDGGILRNDRLIVSWDGSRLDKDDDEPRVEVTLTPTELST